MTMIRPRSDVVYGICRGLPSGLRNEIIDIFTRSLVISGIVQLMRGGGELESGKLGYVQAPGLTGVYLSTGGKLRYLCTYNSDSMYNNDTSSWREDDRC